MLQLVNFVENNGLITFTTVFWFESGEHIARTGGRLANAPYRASIAPLPRFYHGSTLFDFSLAIV